MGGGGGDRNGPSIFILKYVDDQDVLILKKLQRRLRALDKKVSEI